MHYALVGPEMDINRRRKPTYKTDIMLGKAAALVVKARVDAENDLEVVFLMYRIFAGIDLNSNCSRKTVGKLVSVPDEDEGVPDVVVATAVFKDVVSKRKIFL